MWYGLWLGLSCAVGAQNPAASEDPPAPPPLEWVLAGAQAGDPLAQLTMAILYEERESFTNAVRWLRLASAGGQSEAQFKLAYALTIGRGVQRDMAEAVRWYQAAAERDHAEAQYNLAVCLEKGLGTKPDLAAAFQWHTKAAMLGDDFAQKALGVCYERGLGVKADPAEAYKWYHLAAERGNPDGLKLRSLLQPRLSAAQLAEGKRRYAELVAKAPQSMTVEVAPKPDQPRTRPVDFLE